MKNGDIIRKRITLPKGTALIVGLDSEEQGRRWINSNDAISKFGCIPMYDYIPDELNLGKFCLVNTYDIIAVIEATVAWCVGKEAGVSYLKPQIYKGMCAVIDINEWEVIQEAKVANEYLDNISALSEDELRASIDSLRNKRTSNYTNLPAKPVKVKVKVEAEVDKSGTSKTSTKNNSMLDYIDALPADKKKNY